MITGFSGSGSMLHISQTMKATHRSAAVCISNLHRVSLCEETKAHNPVLALNLQPCGTLQWADEDTRERTSDGDEEISGCVV